MQKFRYPRTFLFGFKLRDVVDDRSKLVSFKTTRGDVVDVNISKIVENLGGVLVDNRRYISKKIGEMLSQKLSEIDY